MSRPRVRLLAVPTAALLLLTGAVVGASPASAQDPGIGFGFSDGGGEVEIRETQEGEQFEGASGSNGGTSSVSDAPPPDCRWFPDRTGPEMAAYAASFVVPMFPAPPPGWEAYAETPPAEGRWWRPDCVFSATASGTADTLEARARVWRTSQPFIWSGQEPAPPPVPVPDLVTLVRDELTVPTPQVAVNPAGETVTSLQTWVWPVGGGLQPVVAEVRSGPNFARITATPGRLVLSAPGAEVGPCNRPVAYTPGAPDSATDCFVVFRESSAGLPGGRTRISAGVEWTAVLETSDPTIGGPLGAVTRTTQVGIAVAEVQSVLR